MQNRHQIKLFYSIEEYQGLFQTKYIDLFGNIYNDVFILSDGRMFELSQVESWSEF